MSIIVAKCREVVYLLPIEARGFNETREKQVPAYGTSVTIKGTTYNYIIDTKAQVRELLLGCTASVEKVVIQEETRGLPHRELSAQEILDIVLDHPQEEDTDADAEYLRKHQNSTTV
jgi:hypothetical protein